MSHRLRLALQSVVPYWGEPDARTVALESLRLAAVLLAALNPLFWAIFRMTTPTAHDPLWVRGVIVGGALVILALSYVEGPVRRHPRRVLVALVHTMLVGYAILTAVNDLATDYAVGYYFVVLASAMVYSLVWTRSLPMALMLLVSVGMASVTCAFVDPATAGVSRPAFLLVLVTGSFVVYAAFAGRLQAARGLARSEAQLAGAERLAAVGSWTFDLASGRRSWSDGAYRLLGVERGGPTPSLLTFLHADDLLRFEEWYEAILAGTREVEEGQVEDRFRAIRTDGETRVFRSVVQATRTEAGGVTGLSGVFLDITEQVGHEAALEAERDRARAAADAKDTFLSNMSHEIRTPLTAIIGYAQILGEEAGDDLQDLVEPIESGGQRLLDTLNSVLDLARMDAGETDLVLVPTDLGREAKGAVEMLVGQARAKGLDLTLEAPADAVMVDGDPAGLSRVLTNLLSNAVKFTEQGRVTVRVRRAGTHAEVDVADTGRGMDEAFLEELFEPFRQASTGWGRSHEGTGLGLTITRRLVEAMRGTIRVESAPGEGTCFTLTLPVLADARGDGAEGAPVVSAPVPADA